MTANEAAERLRTLMKRWVSPTVTNSMLAAVDAALFVERENERRATVERMIAHYGLPGTEDSVADVYRTMGLDEEAAR